MNKELCPIHHLFYKGDRCPLCEQERLEGYASKYGKYGAPPTEKVKEVHRPITESDINALINKFKGGKK